MARKDRDFLMHYVEILSGLSPLSTKISLDGHTFQGVKSLDVKMRVNEVVTVTTEFFPEELLIVCEAVDLFVVIGDKKYMLAECG